MLGLQRPDKPATLQLRCKDRSSNCMVLHCLRGAIAGAGLKVSELARQQGFFNQENLIEDAGKGYFLELT
ncbi:MAG: hypothetical protein DYG96_14930 [Chlorobi bacterium CHB2]|nr:hypothetical protein [Chlorobi bacterium CHB2]